MKPSCRRNVPLDSRVAGAPNSALLAGVLLVTHRACRSASEDALFAVIHRKGSSAPCGSCLVAAGGSGTTLVLSVAVLVGDDSGKRDVPKWCLTFGGSP